MKKIYLLAACTLVFFFTASANYYVDALHGSNGNSGLSPALAKATIQAAASLTSPGDTVFIMDGTYTNSGTVLNITVSGTEAAPIVYTNFPGSVPRVAASIGTYNIIYINPGVNYITINGLEVIGYGVSLSLATDTTAAQATESCPVIGSKATSSTFVIKYNGNGIVVNTQTATVGCHHIRITNNKIHDCTAAGIAFVRSDYVTVENNTVYNNSWYTIYGSSGISFNYSYNYDANTTTYRNFVRNNVCYGNRLYSLWNSVCKITDGNGIILDIPLPEYNGRTLVENNLCYNNGGSGIHTLQTNHVDMINNTSYYNSASPEIDGAAIYAYNADDVKFYNNILVARPNKRVSLSGNSTNQVYDYNLYYGGSKIEVVGTNSVIQDPKFVNASTDPAVADFHLLPGSFAVNTGDNTHTTPFDLAGNSRPQAQTVDMGAYESVYSGRLNSCDAAAASKAIGNANGTGEPGAIFYGPYDSKPGTANQQSRHAFIYPATLLTNYGLPGNSLITNLQFRRSVQVSATVTTASTQTVPDNSIIRIYLRNEATDNFGTAAFSWNTILPAAADPAVLVYAGEAAPFVGNGGGWKTVHFQTPFQYTGLNLGIYVEYLQKGSIASATDINWIYDNGGSQPLYNTTTYPNQLYATKTSNASGSTTISDNLTANNERRPVLMLGYCSMQASLPVSLRGFDAVKNNGSVYVNWLAAYETNNAGFDVQRSADGVLFQAIGFVAATGSNGPAFSKYSFTDPAPLSGTGYYRLVQKDRDGKLTYSAVVQVTHATGVSRMVSLFPNPAQHTVNAWVNISGPASVASVSVQDMSGKLISRFTQPLKQGYNNIEINVSALPGSTYLLVVQLSTGEKFTSKLIKK